MLAPSSEPAPSAEPAASAEPAPSAEADPAIEVERYVGWYALAAAVVIILYLNEGVRGKFKFETRGGKDLSLEEMHGP